MICSKTLTSRLGYIRSSDLHDEPLLMARLDLYANPIDPKVRMTHVVTRLKLNKELYDEMKKMSKSGHLIQVTLQLGEF